MRALTHTRTYTYKRSTHTYTHAATSCCCSLLHIYNEPSHFKLPSADVISIQKTDEKFRLLYDVKGRFAVHRISNEEAKVPTPIFMLATTRTH